MQGGLLQDIVVRQRSDILQLITSKDQALLIGRKAFLILDLFLDAVDGVGGLNDQGDGLASHLHKDLHTTT